MSRRVLILGAVSFVLVAAVLVNLAVLDVISTRDLTRTLTRTLLVVGVSTLALVLVTAIARMDRRSPGARKDTGS
jgi:hypothetical protein